MASPSRSSSVASRSSSDWASFFLRSATTPFLVGVDDVERLEPVLDVDAELAVLRALLLRDVRRALREVADVTDAGLDGEAAAEVAGDGPRLGGGLDDDEAGHVA